MQNEIRTSVKALEDSATPRRHCRPAERAGARLIHHVKDFEKQRHIEHKLAMGIGFRLARSLDKEKEAAKSGNKQG